MQYSLKRAARVGFEPATSEGLKLIGKLTHTYTQRTARIDYGSKGGAFSNPDKRGSTLDIIVMS